MNFFLAPYHNKICTYIGLASCPSKKSKFLFLIMALFFLSDKTSASCLFLSQKQILVAVVQILARLVIRMYLSGPVNHRK